MNYWQKLFSEITGETDINALQLIEEVVRFDILSDGERGSCLNGYSREELIEAAKDAVQLIREVNFAADLRGEEHLKPMFQH